MSSFNFGWRKKANDKVQASSVFNQIDNDEEDEVNLEEVDWRSLVNKGKQANQEDQTDKLQRLHDEGVTLAEEERYWEAIGRWQQALEMSPQDEKLHEMISQALMELGEIFPAVQAAEKSIKLKPTWAEAHQTLGRAQLNIGEIELALKSFQRAQHLRPDDPQLWQEDIEWTKSLIKRKDEIAIEKLMGEKADRDTDVEMDDLDDVD
eukprot:gene5517-6202_t